MACDEETRSRALYRTIGHRPSKHQDPFFSCRISCFPADFLEFDDAHVSIHPPLVLCHCLANRLETHTSFWTSVGSTECQCLDPQTTRKNGLLLRILGGGYSCVSGLSRMFGLAHFAKPGSRLRSSILDGRVNLMQSKAPSGVSSFALSRDLLKGPPVPLYPFSGEGSPAKINYRRKGTNLFYPTGGP